MPAAFIALSTSTLSADSPARFGCKMMPLEPDITGSTYRMPAGARRACEKSPGDHRRNSQFPGQVHRSFPFLSYWRQLPHRVGSYHSYRNIEGMNPAEASMTEIARRSSGSPKCRPHIGVLS